MTTLGTGLAEALETPPRAPDSTVQGGAGSSAKVTVGLVISVAGETIRPYL